MRVKGNLTFGQVTFGNHQKTEPDFLDLGVSLPRHFDRLLTDPVYAEEIVLA